MNWKLRLAALEDVPALEELIPLYGVCGYSEVERYEVPMSDGLTLPVVRMTKQLVT